MMASVWVDNEWLQVVLMKKTSGIGNAREWTRQQTTYSGDGSLH